jgi:hypothetical protein
MVRIIYDGKYEKISPFIIYEDFNGDYWLRTL